MAARYSSGPKLFLSDVRLSFSDPLPRHITLTSNESHYLRDVLRLAVGDHLEVGDPETGTSGLAAIESISQVVTITITAWAVDQRPRQREILVLCALLKGDKNEQILDWSTELGCSATHFWQSPRSVVRVKGPDDAAHRSARFTKVALAAAQQSRQLKPPLVAVHLSLRHALDALAQRSPMARYLCSLAPDSTPLVQACASAHSALPALIIVGPEGDLAPEESKLLIEQAHVTPVTLGPSVLRSELAVVSAIAAIRAAECCLEYYDRAIQ